MSLVNKFSYLDKLLDLEPDKSHGMWIDMVERLQLTEPMEVELLLGILAARLLPGAVVVPQLGILVPKLLHGIQEARLRPGILEARLLLGMLVAKLRLGTRAARHLLGSLLLENNRGIPTCIIVVSCKSFVKF